MDVVRIFDTTLRDGEQSPGFSMNTAEKIRLARQLAALNVDVIEAGFPIASRGDLEAVKKVAQEVRTVPIAALARARKEDVTAAIEALKPAAAPRLHVFLATSDLHLRVKLKMTREQALEAIGSMIRYGRQHVAEVEFSAEDAGRTDIGFLCQVCRVAVDAGAAVLNLPDTVGYAVPEEYGAMFTKVREYLGDAQGITLSAHCHDDLGMAVANSLAAIRAGVRQIECTINGIGERAGNASLEEVVVALAVRQDSFGVTTGIRLEQLFPTSRMLTAHRNYWSAGRAEQSDCRRERLRARSGNSPGWHHQESADVRDNVAAVSRGAGALACSRKALRAQRAAYDSARPGIRSERDRAC